ncbi:FAD-dependent thymidylate synthase [Clostridium sp. FP2]|uniref:FAD-dependent thymidylate synthase n=1 Tax=Clostridium sp. FP2 TaxID=2724481 RepID=UPI0013E96420|nr:FAD-dependent thymidylate synthase [Clostridium sp. FP2]MBZ9622987.1 FAD-dependent thymidylate synthase [Clostridium sp. FP2]
MNKIKGSYVIESEINGMDLLKQIEKVGRTCYKSEGNITEDSAVKFVAGLISRGHEAMIEHNCISVRFICDRGVSHELVRHRLASFGQESTRYCNYSKDKFSNQITVIEPIFWDKETYGYELWNTACLFSEKAYFNLLEGGASPQEARSVLPNSLKTEIVVTMNLREWRHFFKLRTPQTAHPQMRELTIPLLAEFKTLIPVIFDDIKVD